MLIVHICTCMIEYKYRKWATEYIWVNWLNMLQWVFSNYLLKKNIYI